MRLLLAEDDAELADGITHALRQSGYAVDWVADGAQADAALLATEYDLLVLDLGLPGVDGFEVLKRLRDRGGRTFVLILTARDEVENRIRGLDLGADDYLTKPFALGELEARLRALNRRVRSDGQIKPSFGSLTLDTLANQVLANGVALDLTQREYDVLGMLIERGGKVVSKDFLFERLYGWDAQSTPSAIEVFISRIRRKIEPAGMTVRVIRGLGYLLEAEAGGTGNQTQ
jgi:two-component system OmpR family response regulator